MGLCFCRHGEGFTHKSHWCRFRVNAKEVGQLRKERQKQWGWAWSMGDSWAGGEQRMNAEQGIINSGNKRRSEEESRLSVGWNNVGCCFISSVAAQQQPCQSQVLTQHTFTQTHVCTHIMLIDKRALAQTEPSSHRKGRLSVTARPEQGFTASMWP